MPSEVLMLSRLLLLSVLVSLGLASAPAHAGRASACKAPPFSVPKETQHAVDAAIEARVVGTGAGALSTNVETRTDYETTTLSQDAAARSWVEYTLCLKLAKKLISQELHDELLRSLIAPAVPSPAPDEAATPADVVAAHTAQQSQVPLTSDQIIGSWKVISRFQWSTCPEPHDSYGTSAYAWLVGTDSVGGIRVDVAGTTAFPSMYGQIHGRNLILAGVRGGSNAPLPSWTFTHADGGSSVIYSSAAMDLNLEDGALRGTRDVTLYCPAASVGDAVNITGVRLQSCQVRYVVEATR